MLVCLERNQERLKNAVDHMMRFLQSDAGSASSAPPGPRVLDQPL